MSQDATQILCVRPVAEHDSPRGAREVLNKTAGHDSFKQRLGRPISGFHQTFGNAERKYAANFGTLEHAALFMNRNRR